MNHHEKHSNVAIVGIIALVCIVGVILGSFYYYKHHEPAERSVAHMPSPMIPAAPIEEATEEVTHYVDLPPARPVEKVTHIVEYEEPIEPAPRPRREKRPVNVSLSLGFQKVVNPAPQGEWCIYEEDHSCRPCPARIPNNMRRCDRPQQAHRGSWTGDHSRVVNLMNKFANQVLDRNNNSAYNTLEQAKQIVRGMRNSGQNMQATNSNGATLYSVVQQVVVAIAGRLPANMQASLNELNSLLR